VSTIHEELIDFGFLISYIIAVSGELVLVLKKASRR
jgi:hypothetical protein